MVWLSLEELSQQPNLDPLLNLLTLLVRLESELAASSQQILARRPDLKIEEQIMVIAGIPREEIRHTRAVQDWLAEVRQEGRQEGVAAVTVRHSTAAAAPSARSPPPRFRPCRWSSWKPWPTPCSTSKARPT